MIIAFRVCYLLKYFLRSGKFRGHCHVTFKDNDIAAKALKSLKGLKVADRVVFAAIARSGK